MLVKSRKLSVEMQIYQSLNARMTLLEKEKQYLWNLEKGYEGECMFDALTEKLEGGNLLFLNDLLLKHNNTTFQIDSLIITPQNAYLFEVKNFEGDYVYDARTDQLHLKTNSKDYEVTNPLTQLNRCNSLLRQFLNSYGFNLPILASVVFINSEFTLYQSPLDKPFIYPTQVNRYLRSLENDFPSGLNSMHTALAEKLTSLHIVDSPFKNLPDYSYDQVRKGLVCAGCASLSVYVEGRSARCVRCHKVETLEEIVLRHVREFRMLFPEKPVSTKSIHEWGKGIGSQKTIKRILDKHFEIKGSNRWSYFE
ncbi:nuclease-related domain-containing protein [Bacillus sp. CHD6a]|uniref:nuclease-related domain-containing protein n=1 Tax=Bacillus sp. CHD6a TaxID=1643452 RepID=UPI0006CD0939|nr:nuclease-related domain-containing protein [Bacillus sp. CHD6a]KPB04531.1 nuclease [Bacillus sp. CHD6a]